MLQDFIHISPDAQNILFLTLYPTGVIFAVEFYCVNLAWFQIRSKDKRCLAGDLKCRRRATDIYIYVSTLKHLVQGESVQVLLQFAQAFFFSADSPCQQRAAVGPLAQSETTRSSFSFLNSYTRCMFSSLTRVPTFPECNLKH